MRNQIAAAAFPPNRLLEVGPVVWAHLEAIAARSCGRWSAASIMRSVEAGKRMLWVVKDDARNVPCATALTEITTSDLGHQTIRVIAVEGDDWLAWQDPLLDTVKQFGAEMGCGSLSVIAGPGWGGTLKHRMTLRTLLFEEDIEPARPPASCRPEIAMTPA